VRSRFDGFRRREVERPIDTLPPGGERASAFVLVHLRVPPPRNRVVRAQLVEP
jgi:hypothetical protein